jgi:hypothetical protein
MDVLRRAFEVKRRLNKLHSPNLSKVKDRASVYRATWLQYINSIDVITSAELQLFHGASHHFP